LCRSPNGRSPRAEDGTDLRARPRSRTATPRGRLPWSDASESCPTLDPVDQVGDSGWRVEERVLAVACGGERTPYGLGEDIGAPGALSKRVVAGYLRPSPQARRCSDWPDDGFLHRVTAACPAEARATLAPRLRSLLAAYVGGEVARRAAAGLTGYLLIGFAVGRRGSAWCGARKSTPSVHRRDCAVALIGPRRGSELTLMRCARVGWPSRASRARDRVSLLHRSLVLLSVARGSRSPASAGGPTRGRGARARTLARPRRPSSRWR